MAYTPPAGDALAFSFNGPEGYAAPPADALDFAFGDAGVTDLPGATLALQWQAAGSLLDEPLAAAAGMSLAVVGQLVDAPLAAAGVLELAVSPPDLVDVDTDFYALCTLQLNAAATPVNEALQAAPSVGLQAGGLLADEPLLATPRIRVNFAAALDGDRGGGRAPPGINVATGGRWRWATARDQALAAGFADPPPRDPRLAIGWGFPPVAAMDTAVAWTRPEARQAPVAALWHRPGATPQTQTAGDWRYPPARDTPRGIGWDGSVQPREAQIAGDWLYPPARDVQRRNGWERTDRYGQPYVRPPAYVPPPADAIAFEFGAGESYQASDAEALGFEFRPPKPNRRSVATDTAAAVPFVVVPPRRDSGQALVWGLGGAQSAVDPQWDVPYPQQPPIEDDPAAPAVLPAYLLMPSIEVTRLSDGAAILCNAVSAATDQDSWSWSFDLVPARREDLDLMRPTTGGPAEIEIRINGWTWHALVERYTRQRQFGAHSWAVQARSLGALFAAPYAAPATRLETSDRLAQQLAGDEVTLPDWTLQWDAVDWLVPGGVYSYENATPMDSLNRLARAAGGTVATGRASKTITVAPQYPAAPWDWPTTTPDVVLPESLIGRLSGDWQPGPRYNAVYVAGQQQGVLVHVVRDGTGGNRPAPTVVDALNTDQAPGRSRGIVVIGQSAYRESVDIRTPLLPDPEPPGLIEPGKLIEVGEAEGSWVGLVTGCRVEATRQNALSVRQQLTVERNHAA